MGLPEKREDVTAWPEVFPVKKCEINGTIPNYDGEKMEENGIQKSDRKSDETNVANFDNISTDSNRVDPELFAYFYNCPKTRFFFQKLVDDKFFDLSVP